LAAYENVHCYFGKNRTKVQAVNADLDKHPDFDLLMMAADDLIPQVRGYDDVLIGYMKRYFPGTDGALFTHDGFQGRRLNTIPIMGGVYYRRFGYITHPDYRSLWGDNEFTDVANLLGRQVYIDRVILRHEHPRITGQRPDPLYEKNNRDDETDHATYLRRREILFGISPRILLSVLILLENGESGELIETLTRQVTRLGLSRTVEILSEPDGRRPGEARAKLLARANGEYVCFLDAGDDVGESFVEAVCREIADGTVDCVAVPVRRLGPPSAAPAGSQSASDAEGEAAPESPPDRWCPMRRDIASRYPFVREGRDVSNARASDMARDGALKTVRQVEGLFVVRLDGVPASHAYGALAEL
jgi:hypothetical protein